MEREQVFITVIGMDRKGIVASVSSYLYDWSLTVPSFAG